MGVVVVVEPLESGCLGVVVCVVVESSRLSVGTFLGVSRAVVLGGDGDDGGCVLLAGVG